MQYLKGMCRANSCELFRILSWLDLSTDSKAFLVRGAMGHPASDILQTFFQQSDITLCKYLVLIVQKTVSYQSDILLCENFQPAEWTCENRFRLQKVRTAKQIIEDFVNS